MPLPPVVILYAIFVLSGAAGLMYESIWSRYLGLFVGHGAYAQILVLVIFLGGMSLGAALVGRRSERLRDPLRWYAAAELAVAAIGLVFHGLFVAVTEGAYDALFPHLPAGALVTIAKWAIAALLILPQSVLLGTTFPLMSAGTLRRAGAAPGRTLALLYFANSLGAAGGVLVAGFWLLERAGLPGTLQAAAALNAVVAVVAWLVSRAEPETAPATAPGTAPPADAAAPAPAGLHVPPALARALLVVAFGTAAASFVYEIAWIRMLSLVVGSATHSFEIMLSAFILGLALGAWWVRRRADRWQDPVRALGLVQWTMGALAVATLPVYLLTFRAMAGLLDALDLTTSGYRLFGVARYLLCLGVMLPATFCAGITLPLITRILLARGGGAGSAGERAVGRVYAVNTLGSIVGAALAGLVLMPVLGLRWLLVAGALTDTLLGVWLLHRHTALAALAAGADDATPAAAPDEARPGPARAVRRAAAGSEGAALASVALVGAAVVFVLAGAVPFDPAVLTSGVYRYGVVSSPKQFEVPFYEDGRTATVSVRRHVQSDSYTLSTNGKPDASLDRGWLRPQRGDTTRRPLLGDAVTQSLLPIIALAHRPDARSAAVIGQGSGMTSHLLLGSPTLRSLVTIDIEPAMIRGSRFFYPANRRVFDDPRSSFAVDDAKAYFASAHRRFDLIVSEPSNPWVSGVSGLFTDEFYDRVRGYLAPGGVFGQWLHLYEIDDALVTSVLAALHRHFPAYEIYMVSQSDLFVVATNDRALRPADWRVLDFPGLRADLARTVPLDPEALGALRLADRAALAPLLDGWAPVNSDFRPVLDLGAERTRFLKHSAEGYRAVHVGSFDPLAARRGWRVPPAASYVAPFALPRHTARARAAALRATWDARAEAIAAGGRADEAPWPPLDAEDAGWLREALYRRGTLESELASGSAPADWHGFVLHAVDVLGDAEGGTAGVPDTTLHARLAAYAASAGAPPEVRAALAFLRGTAAYDWPAASDAAEVLVRAAARGDAWLPAGQLHDGAVVAALAVRRPERAVRAAEVLGPVLRRRRGDVRSALFTAWITAASGAAPRPTTSDSARRR
jgi:predicted membrane-bound spermidine synthase